MAFFVFSILITASVCILFWSKKVFFNFDEELDPLPMSLIIPTWNEELVIKSKLDSIIKQNYPSELLEIIIIDGGSSDKTLDIISKWKDSLDLKNSPKIRIIEEEERLGKSVSINRAFSEATLESQILMMSDVDCRLSENTLISIGKIFHNEEIGAVTARQILINSDVSISSQNETNYRDFFTRIRIAESLIDSTPIFHGECSAYRREAIKNHRLVENANADDSQMAVAARIAGYRAIYAPNLTFLEAAPPDNKSTNIQKIRRAQGLSRHFWRNKRHMFDKNLGNFRKVLALEFSLHILLPWFVFFGFISGFLHIGYFIFQNNISSLALSNLPFLEKLLFFSDFSVLLLLSFGSLRLNIPLSQTSYAFFQYMVILLKAHFLILSGKSLHLWQQVPNVRETLRDYDLKNDNDS